MPTPGPRTSPRYSAQFKATAVRLSQLPGGAVQDVAQSPCIHPCMLSRWRKEAREGTAPRSQPDRAARVIALPPVIPDNSSMPTVLRGSTQASGIKMAVLATFRSDLRPPFGLLARLWGWGAALSTITILIVRGSQGRLPVPDDLFLLLVPTALGLLAGLFLFILGRLQTVQILTTGLRCYDPGSRYHVVRWQDIVGVEVQRPYGLPYLFMTAKGVEQPITLPLWLKVMKGFVDLAEAQAGAGNMLVAALQTATWKMQSRIP